MKKNVLFAIMLLCQLSAAAQLKVLSSGNVAIANTDVNQEVTMAVGSYADSLGTIQRIGVYSHSNGNQGSLFSTGIRGEASNFVSPSIFPQKY